MRRGEIPACDQPLGEGRRVEFGFRGVALFRMRHAERADDVSLAGRPVRIACWLSVQAEQFEYGQVPGRPVQ